MALFVGVWGIVAKRVLPKIVFVVHKIRLDPAIVFAKLDLLLVEAFVQAVVGEEVARLMLEGWEVNTNFFQAVMRLCGLSIIWKLMVSPRSTGR